MIDQLLGVVTIHPWHGRHGFRLLEAILDKDRSDEACGSEMSLLQHGPDSIGAAQSPHANGNGVR